MAIIIVPSWQESGVMQTIQKLCLIGGQMTPKVCFQLQAEILYAKQGFQKQQHWRVSVWMLISVL